MNYRGEVLDAGRDWITITGNPSYVTISFGTRTYSMSTNQAADLGRHLIAASETSQPSPVATRAETEAAPELVAEAQGHSHRPMAFVYWSEGVRRVTLHEDLARNADVNYRGLYVRDGR